MAERGFDIINARFTHRNMPLYKLERYSFKDRAAAYEAFRQIPGISEIVIVQTASRVEIFTAITREADAPDARSAAGAGLTVKQIEKTWIPLGRLDQYDLDHFDQMLEVYRNEGAYASLLRLVTGLDSVVVGKSEIAEEVRASIAHARASGSSGPLLEALFDTALLVGAKIRGQTGIGDDVLTIGDVAVKMAEDNVGIDAKKKVLLVGTGDYAAQVAKVMNARGSKFEVASRSAERAEGFSKLLGGSPVKFEDALSSFDKYDIVFVATTADYHILTDERIRRVMEDKKTGTMILDVSEPRAVNEDVSAVPGIKLMFRDQIAEQEERSLKTRLAKIPEVEKLIKAETPIVSAMIDKIRQDSVRAGG